MPTATKATTRPSSTKSAKATASDTGLLRERASYWRSEGLSDTEVRRELRDEGFSAGDISGAVGTPSPDDSSPSEPPPASPSSPAPAGGSKSRRSTSSSKRSVGLGPVRISTPGTPAGMLLAIVAYPAVLAYLTGGPTELKAWFRAKFLNQTSTDAGIHNEAFVQLDALFGSGSAGSAARPAAALSTYGQTPPPAPPKRPATSDGLPPEASGPNAYNAITGTWGKGHDAGNGSKGQRAVAFARSQLGKPYKWGGTGPDRWDCSGLTQASWRAAGVKIPRTTGLQILTGRRVTRKNLAAGDLVFSTKGHVQLYIGAGQVIEAPRTGLNVRVAALGRFLTARRPG